MWNRGMCWWAVTSTWQGGAAPHQGQHLLEVKVVAGGDSLQLPMVQNPRGGKWIGDIQGKIAVAGSKGCQHLELVGIAHQVAIGGRPHQGL